MDHVAFSRDGHRILTYGDDQTASVWEAATGKVIRHFRDLGIAGNARVDTASFDPEGNRVLTANSAGTAHAWDIETGVRSVTLPASVGRSHSYSQSEERVCSARFATRSLPAPFRALKPSGWR
ncbi:MAG: hypothetical protein L0Z50_41995 [Verrucomicrobiales bacterium]|nr:hypothetical protein [Verrucomicrobiales bacterium]